MGKISETEENNQQFFYDFFPGGGCKFFSNFPQKMLGYRKSNFTIFSIFSRLYVHTQSTQFGQSNFFMRRMKLKVHQLKAGNKQLSLSIVIFHCHHSV